MIEDSVARVEHGTKLVGQSGQSLSDIVTAVKKASDIVAEIAAACQEQARGIDQVNKAITSLDQVTQQNAALVEEAASSAEVLSEEAQHLDRMMANYQIAAGAGSAASTAVASQETNSARGGSKSVERRGAGRAWASKSTGRRATTSVAADISRPAAPKAAAATAGDSDWTEF